MSKSNWKFLSVNKNDMIFFLTNKFNLKKSKLNFFIKKNKTVNNFNKNFKGFIHFGKLWRKNKPLKLHLSNKFGMFLKTRKPFFFRSKKKKNW